MAENISKLVDKGFQNWIKANLALNITKDGIEDVVLTEINTFHQDTLNDILSPEQILNNDLCRQCKNENILPCPTRGICIVKTGLCSFHYTQQKWYRPCPKHICDRLREKIKQCHKYNFPSWKNTKAEDWCQNPWELAKCYLPPDGYLGVTSIAETDINGIVSVIMNHSAFKNKVIMRSCDQVREVTRRVRHSPDLCISDQDMNNILDTLVAFLGSSLFQGDLKAATSVQKITKLKTDSLTITTNDVTKVLQNVIHENTKKSLQVVNETLAERAREIKVDLDKLDEVASKSIKDIFIAKVSAIDDIEGSKRTAIDDIKSTTVQLKTEFNSDIDKVKTQAVAEIEDMKQTFIDTEYQRLKADFKSDLLEFNQQYHSTIPLSSIFDEHDTHLQGFYVQPTMNSIEVQKTTLSGPAVEVRKPIKSLQDVFYRKSKPCSNIYLTSGAGLGKTVFCKQLVLAWCHAHGNHSSESKLFVEYMQVMKDFEYIFLLSLRNSTAQCDVDDMIASQVVQNLANDLKYTPDFMQRLLHREKCLILLDGLDEWSHPEPSVSICTKTQDDLPHRKPRQNCTILTTTRSWKLSIVNLKSSQIDNHIEIGYLDDESSRQLIANAVKKILVQDDTDTCINDGTNSQIEDTTTEIRSRSTPEFEKNPLILTYMICLLCDGKSLGQSKSELYANIIDFLLHRWEKRQKKVTKVVFADNAVDTVLLPAVFRNCGHIKAYGKILLSLGQLAFKALFCEIEERSLVFRCSLMDSCLNEDEKTFCLSAGLLIQNKLPGRLISNETTVSFSHKTFQEFLAALYIYAKADHNDAKESVLEKCNSVENILEMSNVFIFLSGLCPERLHILTKELSKIINGDKMIIQFRSKSTLSFGQHTLYKTVKDLQDMYIACVKESKDANHASANPLLQDVIIDRDRYKEGHLQMLQQLIKTNTENIKSIWLSNCESEMDTQNLIRNPNLENIHTLESLFLFCPIVTEDLDHILAGSVNTLNTLVAASVMWKGESRAGIYRTLSDSSVKLIRDMNYLTSLSLFNFRMSHCLLQSLISHLTHRTCMKHITLVHITCIDHGESCPGFSMDLSQHDQLVTTGLGGLPLIHVLINTSVLEVCYAGPLQTSSSFSSFLNCLPDAKKLRLFYYFQLHERGNDLSNMMDTIPRLNTIKELVVVNTDIKNKVLKLSCDANIEYIHMMNTTMTSSSLEQLVQQVEQLLQSVQVMLEECTVTPAEEYERITDYIKSSGRFEVILDGENENVYGVKSNSFVFRTIRD
ncbi:uncharacterized protein LOC128548413 [Mercenaria mercenaria]|uniref:uncharacterized protein LOC128548413 n=1 Tax=Mercenaria mercenaria TaxID=6596 RepID=UPI00234E3C68|nr:uncharacterized protein LOC128548413 [Mercenaria mercenaria]